jgi:uncharacterized membrane protein YoaK (UPF0700 family)
VTAPATNVRVRPERLYMGVLLAVVGGGLDAYTYVSRGGVFANAQTGNVVLFGVEAAAGQWARSLLHLPPIAAFVLGQVAALGLARARASRALRHAARLVLVLEILVLVAVGLVPARWPDEVVTVAVAFVSSVQVGTFRMVDDVTYKSTMTTGNLERLVGTGFGWLADADAAAGRRTRRLLAIIAGFAAGAAFGAVATRAIGDRAVWLGAGLLAVVLAAVVAETRSVERTATITRR